MTKEIYATADKKMKHTVELTRKDLSTIRTGRASLAILDGVLVDYYGNPTPLNQVATLAVPDPALITIQPWDVSLVKEIEKALLQSDLGLTPSNDGKIVRLPIPPLTEDRRKQLAKKVHHMGEEGKTIIRQHLKTLLKDKKISEDDEKRALDQIQELTDKSVKQLDELVQHKEKEILSV